MVPSRALSARPTAVGAPVLSSGGQVTAQSAVQTEVPGSSSNRYSARPAPSTRYVPMAPFAVATVAAPPVDLDTAVGPAVTVGRGDPTVPGVGLEALSVDAVAVLDGAGPATVWDGVDPQPTIINAAIAN